MRTEWEYFDRFDSVIDKYMEKQGEGSTVASQVVTAINKLIYKWYNDGDVYDNNYFLQGWVNDLSSYANWLAKYVGVTNILMRIADATDYGDYEDILKTLADNFLTERYLRKVAGLKKMGTIYDCDGPFSFNYFEEEDEDDE